jgi:hypothetical protein
MPIRERATSSRKGQGGDGLDFESAEQSINVLRYARLMALCASAYSGRWLQGSSRYRHPGHFPLASVGAFRRAGKMEQTVDTNPAGTPMTNADGDKRRTPDITVMKSVFPAEMAARELPNRKYR